MQPETSEKPPSCPDHSTDPREHRLHVLKVSLHRCGLEARDVGRKTAIVQAEIARLENER